MTLSKLIGKLQKPKEKPEALFDRETKASKHIPWAYFITDSIFNTTSGCLGAVIKVKGIPFEVQDAPELDQLQSSLSFLIQSLGDEFGLYITLHRNQQSNYLVGEFKAGFAQDFCKAYQEQFKGSTLFKNDLYLTVLLKPEHLSLPREVALLQRFRLKADSEQSHSLKETRLKKLNSTLLQLMSSLKAYSTTVLGRHVLENNSACAEPLSFLSILVNGRSQDYVYPYQDIASFIPNTRLFFGYDTIHFQDCVSAGDQFGAILSVKHYSPNSSAGFLNELLTAPFELISTHSFLSIEKNKALDLIETQVRRLHSTEDAALTQIEELEEAKDDLASGRLSYGYHHNTILVLGKSIKELEDKVAQVSKIYQNRRLNLTRETLNLENAFWAQIPGNAKKIKRSAPISSLNFSCFCSLHNYYSGYIDQNHLGSALMLAETPSKTPLYFNLHERASGRSDDLPKGHATIIGPSNAGKTIILTTIDTMFQKYGIRSYFFDRNYGCEIYIRAAGGHYHRLTPGEPTGWNPCQLEDTAQNRDFLGDFLVALCNGTQALTPTDLNQIAEVVERNYSLPIGRRNLSAIASFFRLDFSGLEALSRYCRTSNRNGKTGDRAYLFDNEQDTFNTDATTLGFDMTHWLSEAGEPPDELLPISMYLFHRIDERLDGKLTALYLDEGWQFLNQPYWQKKLDEYLVTWRKRNAFIVFASQLPDKVAASALGPALIQGSATNIFLANPKAQEADYRGAFKLSQREFELIRSLSLQSRYFLMKQGHEAAITRFNLQGLEKYLTVLSGNDQSVRRCAELRERHGNEPASWLPYFYEEMSL